MTFEPIVSDHMTSCGECDCDIPTGCVVIKRSEPVAVERQRILSKGPATVTIDGVKYDADCTVAQTYTEHDVAETFVCLDCAEPEELETIEAIAIVRPPVVDATPFDVLEIVPVYGVDLGTPVPRDWPRTCEGSCEVSAAEMQRFIDEAFRQKFLPPGRPA